MNRCLQCDCLREPGVPCPGCMVQLGLEEPSGRPPWWGVVCLVGVLGLSVLTTVGVGASFASSRQPSCDHGLLLDEVRAERRALQRARIELKASRVAFEASGVALEASGVALELERTAQADARSDRDQQVQALREEIARARSEAEERTAAKRPPADVEAAAREAARRAHEEAMAAREQAHQAAERARIEAQRAAEERQRVLQAVEGVRLPEPEDCGDRQQLESDAIVGRLSEQTQTCLEAFRYVDQGTARILMADALAKGRSERWYRLGRDFMAAFPTDADIAYKLALHSAKGGRHEDTLQWTDRALKHRSAWTGKAYTSRVYALFKLKYHASMQRHGVDAQPTRLAFIQFDEFARSSGRPRPERPPGLPDDVH